MRYGAALPTWDRFATPDALKEVASAAEAAGFDSAWVGDHIVLPAGWSYPSEYHLEPLAALSWLAASTAKIGLGTTVLVLPYRNPVFAAKSLATVDVLSGGRLELGVGAGWLAEEFAALGVPFSERGARTDEAIRVMRDLWQTQPSSFEGRFTGYSNVSLVPKAHPGREGTIPVLVGGNSKRAVRRAAELGDGWHPVNLSPPELRGAVERYRAACASAGREPGRVVLRQYPGYGEADAEGRRPLTGSPEQWARDAREYERAGCDEIVLSWEADDVEGLVGRFRDFATQVMPGLAT